MVRILLVVYSFVFMIPVSAQVSSDVHTHRGNQSFEKGDFDDASYHYLKTLEDKSDDFRAQYNLGNTLYKKNQYSDAVSTYQKALKNAKTKEQKTAALYNLGNAYYKNKQHKQALKLDPNNQTILKNLQIALQKKDSKQQQQEQDQQQSQQQQNNEQNKGEKENPMDMYAPEKDKLKKEQQEGQQQEENSNKEEPNQPKELEKELLRYIEERERHTAKRALGKQGYAQPQSNRKDW